ncbi:hypothetical protein SAMN05216419_100442 [Nitrosomonas cryotolerans]|uniref:STAS domain-containing protein n=1 Tax=Nitrosomonas cryotolerans ATCC 49181 TaxID=1131553 RepID=A0A1N6JBT4_9PROT|nr:hypothetical protein [Nitrosomonas cryotolerans]SFP48533.1 hypothetical protein SAMN05216419_100442 [Nitrosomonas cryotolerans]SIO41812.1 hypothetical protein SAMN02743940_2482 [Nitrosomonas cryotolerans ATCC 49181]
MMRANKIALDFTSPGALPPDSTDLIRQITAEIETSIRTLEQALETNVMKEAGWQLLASFYLGTNRINDFSALKSRYENCFKTPIFAELGQEKQPPDSSDITFEIPQRITCQSLPEIPAILEACTSRDGAVLDFSRVQSTDISGIKALTNLFTQLPHDRIRLKITGIARFIDNLEKTADSSSGIEEMWNLLFAYHRFCDDMHTFDDLAIKYATRFSISPPSW